MNLPTYTHTQYTFSRLRDGVFSGLLATIPSDLSAEPTIGVLVNRPPLSSGTIAETVTRAITTKSPVKPVAKIARLWPGLWLVLV